MSPLTELVDRSRHYIAERGLGSFCFAVVDFALPKPLGTRFRARRAVFLDAVRLDQPSTLSLAERIEAFRHGLTTDLYQLYGLDCSDRPASQYLDDVSRRHAKFTNDRPDRLDDKAKFDAYLRDCGFGPMLPTVYGQITNGQFTSDRYSTLRDVLRDHDRAVVKRRTGAAGNNVHICTVNDVDTDADGTDCLLVDLERTSADRAKYLVTEYCEQADYAERIFPHAANTIRVLTLRTETDDILVVRAVHRIGSERTGGLDSFSQGGMSAAIDMETGELSAAAEPAKGGEPTWYETHPDTGAAIVGVMVPEWKQIRERIREIAEETTAFSHVGWDLLVTGPGEFKIIEGNSFPDPDVFQVHEPLLVDDDIREFYEHHGVI
ncbi:sugar-transfer associated ATP-grasp domain-containing protein [Halovenus marina]|uniref:sugar-transfer associated ATP-grasp domain-containing protein n=1 Tax=Halovenus marina TaxID=3396621 RepID=UPI003F571E64